MSSEFSNMKKLPYIPPTSPPPIDSLPEEADYEIPDYDITGLSQKLCDEETSITHQPLESTLDDFDVTVDSNLNSLKDKNSSNKDNVFQKIETLEKANSEEESSSSITIPPLDCEGQSLNDCNISDLENDSDNYVDEFNFPRDSIEVTNDGDLKCKFELGQVSPASNSFCQKGEDEFEDYNDPVSNLDKTLEDPIPHLHKKIESNEECVYVNEAKREKVNEIENVQYKRESDCEHTSEYESNTFTPDFSSLNLVYDDGGGGRTDCIKSEENVDEYSNTDKISESFDGDKFSNFVSENKVGNDDNIDDDDFGDFVSERNIDNIIGAKDVVRLKLANETQDKDNDDFGDFISEVHLVENEMRKSDSKEIQENTISENLKKFTSNVDMSDNNDQNGDFGNFVCGNEVKSTEECHNENYDNTSHNNNNEINNEKVNDNFGNVASNKETSPLRNIGNVTLKRLSDKDNSTNNDDDFGNFIGEKGLDTDDDNDDFGDFYSTNVAEESQSEVKMCQENYHDEYFDPSIRYDSPSKYNKYASANDAESKGDKKDSLQLEFSDDEDEAVDKDDEKFSHTEDDDTVLDPDLKENKFHGYFVRWLPKGSRSTASGSFINFSKLKELIDGTFIWYHATNLESCSALQFSWTNSRINKLYLSSLNVDTRNILLGHRSKWISTIPIFAQALSFSPLTPLKPSTNSVNWNMEETSVNVPPNLPYRPEEDASKDSSVTKDIPLPDNKVIPPAKFDWNSSGLTNPLNMPEKELLSSLEKDFTAATTAQEFKSSTSVIEEALKKVNYSSSISSTPSTSQNNTQSSISSAPSTSQNNTQRLSPKIQQFINSIPNLNFMQSKVLAFPIGQTPDFYS